MSEKENQNTKKNKFPMELIPLGLSLIFALAIIVAGYFHGHMDVTKVYHSLHSFT